MALMPGEPDITRRLAASLEAGLPLSQEPFRDIAESLGVSQDFAVSLTEGMLRSGYIRRFGAFWDRSPLCRGYLFGAAVAPEKLERTVRRINGMAAVTHNYLRQHSLNLWFTAIFRDASPALRLSEWFRRSGTPFVALESVRRIRLRPSFAGEAAGEGADSLPPCSATPRPAAPLGGIQKKIAACLCCGMKPAIRLFSGIARLAGLDEPELLRNLAELRNSGLLRRIGASVSHTAAGYVSNSLAAYDFTGAPENDIVMNAQAAIQGRPWASHCYVRKAILSDLEEPWRFNLFVMIHAREESELAEREKSLAASLVPRSPDRAVTMRTLREYKKTSFRPY